MTPAGIPRLTRILSPCMAINQKLQRDSQTLSIRYSQKNETEAHGFRHGEEVGSGFNRLQYFFVLVIL